MYIKMINEVYKYQRWTLLGLAKELTIKILIKEYSI